MIHLEHPTYQKDNAIVKIASRNVDLTLRIDVRVVPRMKINKLDKTAILYVYAGIR